MIPLENAIISPENTKIIDSCIITSKDEMREYLEAVRQHSSLEMAVWQRDMESMLREWRSHNLFYKLHVFRSRTHDVDLELKQPWWRELFCLIMSEFTIFLIF